MAVRHHEYVDWPEVSALSHVAKKSLFAQPDNSNSGRQSFAENNTPWTSQSEALLLGIFKQTIVPKNWDRYLFIYFFAWLMAILNIHAMNINEKQI